MVPVVSAGVRANLSSDVQKKVANCVTANYDDYLNQGVNWQSEETNVNSEWE
jgi:hypothetical protein